MNERVKFIAQYLRGDEPFSVICARERGLVEKPTTSGWSVTIRGRDGLGGSLAGHAFPPACHVAAGGRGDHRPASPTTSSVGATQAGDMCSNGARPTRHGRRPSTIGDLLRRHGLVRP